MTERKYLHTKGDLIDRLSIVLLKSIFISRAPYREEMSLIKHDLGADAEYIYNILVVMLANYFIWNNESLVRSGVREFKFDELSALRATHSINGVRNRAKNNLSLQLGERLDGKIDCLAADLPREFGNWNVFE